MCCLLLINKPRAKDKTYIWLSVRWKTKTSRWWIYMNKWDSTPGMTGCLTTCSVFLLLPTRQACLHHSVVLVRVVRVACPCGLLNNEITKDDSTMDVIFTSPRLVFSFFFPFLFSSIFCHFLGNRIFSKTAAAAVGVFNRWGLGFVRSDKP